MQTTGKSLREVLTIKHVQNSLKDMRDERKTRDALPSAAKRSGGSQASDVAYWLTQPFSKVPAELKIAVVEAREAADRKGPFYNS